MTNEEAISEIKAILEEATETEDAVCYVTSVDAESLNLAIEALSRSEFPNSSDMISRQAAIDALCSECQGRCVPCDNYPCGEVKAIEVLPSAQPEIIHCKDCNCEEWELIEEEKERKNEKK